MLAAADHKQSTPDLIGPVLNGLAEAFVTFWRLWLLIGVVGVAKLAWRVWELRRLSRSGIGAVDLMDGAMFEHFLTTLFRRLGYGVEYTGRRGDYGADLVVTKDGKRIAVQAKRWSKAIGVKAVQEAVASKGMYKCSEALVVANRSFTRQARTLARANDVTLWGRDVLIGKLLAVNHGVPDSQTPAAPEPDAVAEASTTPASRVQAEADLEHCATCGASVTEKVRDYCLTRPDRFGGRIYCFKHQRSKTAIQARGSRGSI